MTFRDRVAAHFRAHPGEWVSAYTLMEIGGSCAWRTRKNECERQLGMRIDNRQRVIRDHASGCPAIQAWDIEGACSCGRSKRYTISEYRYLPASVPVQLEMNQ